MTAAVLKPKPAPENETISDEDRDSLHTLPVAILPVQTPVFRRARLVKNARLETVVEFFSGAGTGRGHLDVRNVNKYLGLPDHPVHPDVSLLRTVGDLPSFDVYSLRILLRANGIALPDNSALMLSPGKIESLSVYMARFTRPLVEEIFGHDTAGARFTDIVGLFRARNPEEVRNRLGQMAGRLGISVDAIPKFLEDYGDIFMSLSYYRDCLDTLLPLVQGFMDSLVMIRDSHQLAQDRSLMKAMDEIEAAVNSSLSSVTGKLESFERSTNDMWRDLTAERFQRIEGLISRYHTSIGAALCAMSVKMTAWANQFPTSSGGVGRRVAFIMSDMRQGLCQLETGQDDAPMLAALND